MTLRTRESILAVSALLLTYSSVPATATTININLTASQDTWLGTGGGFEIGNGGSDPYLYEDLGGADNSFGLLQFDVEAIPDHARVTRATLSLYHVWNGQTGFYLDLFQVTAPWEEMTVTGSTAPSYRVDPVARLLVEDADAEMWRHWDLTSMVASWANGDHPNHGLRIERTPGPIQYPYFVPWPYIVSSEGDPQFVPVLTVEYQENPEPATMFGVLIALAVFAGRAKIRNWQRKSAFSPRPVPAIAPSSAQRPLAFL